MRARIGSEQAIRSYLRRPIVAREVERDMSRCPSCSAELEQEYCPVCGQRRIRPEDLSARRFFHEWFDEFANL